MPSATTVTKGVRGDFGWAFRLLSGLMTTLAIVALVRHAFDTGSLSAPLALIMDAYSGTVRLLLGWAEPYLQAALTWLGSFVDWRPTLYSQWRDVFVLFTLFLGGLVRGFERGLALYVTAIVGSLCFALLTGTAHVRAWQIAFAAAVFISFGLYSIVIGWHSKTWLSANALSAGITILGGFVGAAAFFAIDAGLKLLLP